MGRFNSKREEREESVACIIWCLACVLGCVCYGIVYLDIAMSFLVFHYEVGTISADRD